MQRVDHYILKGNAQPERVQTICILIVIQYAMSKVVGLSKLYLINDLIIKLQNCDLFELMQLERAKY